MRPPVVVCYHAVADGWPSTLATPVGQLEDQVATLARRGYTGLTFAEAERRRRAGTLPHRTVVLTFDDAFQSVLLARPILDRHSFPATVFAIGANGDGQALRWPEIARWTDSPHHAELASLTWDELRDLQRAGWEIGAHSMTHASLPTLSDEDLAFEVEASRSIIAERLGSCATFAYPYGHHDDRVVAAVRRAGFTAACTLAGSHPVDEPFRRPRVGIYRRDSGLRFAVKLSPLSLRARRMTVVRRLERGVRGHGAPDESGSLV